MITTHLDVTNNAKAPTTLSDQPHRWHISARFQEENPDFGGLVWPENDLRHIPRTRDALYGDLWESSSGPSVAATCWTILPSIPLTFGRSGERVRMPHSWPTYKASIVRFSGSTRSGCHLLLFLSLASPPPEASSRSTPRSFVSKQHRRLSTSVPQPTNQPIAASWWGRFRGHGACVLRRVAGRTTSIHPNRARTENLRARLRRKRPFPNFSR